MSVLTDRDIKQRLVNGSIIIWPYNPKNVNTSSYDVTLGDFYYEERRPSLWRRLTRPVFNIWDRDDVNYVWDGPFQAMSLDWYRDSSWLKWLRYQRNFRGFRGDDLLIFIPPGRTILAHTNEFIGARSGATTMMKARSSYGRVFVEVCKCAGWGDVGYYNRWTMEVTNNSKWYDLPLVVGRRIAQIAFLGTGEIEGDDYAVGGKYQTDTLIYELQRNWKPSNMLPRLDIDRDIK